MAVVKNSNTLNDNRNYGIDFLKIIATIIIVFHHYQQVTESKYESGINFYYGNFYWGRLVELFFLISGYVVHRYASIIYENKLSLKDWYVKRAVRLLPVISISVVVYQGIQLCHKSCCNGNDIYANYVVDIWGTIIAACGIQDGGVFPNPSVNNPIWYISVLLICYTFFYLVTVLANRLKTSPYYLYLFMVMLGIGISTYNINLPFINGSTARGYPSFFFGIILAEYIKRNGVSFKLTAASLLTLGLMVYLLVCRRELLQTGENYLLSFLVYPSLIVLTETKTSKKVFAHSIWKIWGQIAFNAYVWHGPMFVFMFTVMHIARVNPNYAQRKWMYLFCFLTQIVGAVSHFFLERPLNNLIKQKIE